MKSFTTIIVNPTGNQEVLEVHASGCRDLRRVNPSLKMIEVLADDAKHVPEVAGFAGARYTYPCCAPLRMAAAGRA